MGSLDSYPLESDAVSRNASGITRMAFPSVMGCAMVRRMYPAPWQVQTAPVE